MKKDKNQADETYSRFLPIANIGRIMKKTLPENAKISREAKETVQECVSQFISFITSEACEKCKVDKRKTINGEDVLSSTDVLGFEDYQHVLKLYLKKYREIVNNEKGEDNDKQDGENYEEDDENEQPNKEEEV